MVFVFLIVLSYVTLYCIMVYFIVLYFMWFTFLLFLFCTGKYSWLLTTIVELHESICLRTEISIQQLRTGNIQLLKSGHLITLLIGVNETDHGGSGYFLRAQDGGLSVSQPDMALPESCFMNMLWCGILALQLLPPNTSAGEKPWISNQLANMSFSFQTLCYCVCRKNTTNHAIEWAKLMRWFILFTRIT